MEHIIYECGSCGCYHPWDWDGDCREDAYRYGSPEEYVEYHRLDAYTVEVRSMDERVQADAS